MRYTGMALWPRGRVWGLATSLGLVAGGVLVAWVIAETMLLTLLAYPNLLRQMPDALVEKVRYIYFRLDRPIVQFEPESARYDAELFYTLRPGYSVLRGREWTSDLAVNRLGLRDDDVSLEGPEIVVVGDSYAMGWGVRQEETFAQVLERRTGGKVLNAAISSYGTVREIRMLDRIDLSRATHLIIQYTGNDTPENRAFVRAGRLETHPETTYRGTVKDYLARRRYWFGRYTKYLLDRLFESTSPAGDAEPLPLRAEAFVYALQHASRQRLDHLQLIVFSDSPPEFFDALQNLVQTHTDLPAWIRNLRMVRLPYHGEDHFMLDDHWTSAGHVHVAEAILPELGLSAPPQ